GAGEEFPDYLASGQGIGSDLPFFVSEYGGIGWDTSGGWGYGSAPKTLEEFYERFDGLARAQLENPGLFGFCYTQLTDVEQEKNGLYYYDVKRTSKFDNARIKAMLDVPAAYEKTPPVNLPVRNPASWVSMVGSGKAPEQLQTIWRYTMEPVTAENWMMPEFDDKAWKQSVGEFSNVAKGAKQWKTAQIYLRQAFQYDGVSFDRAVLAINWDEDAVVYINGEMLKELPRWSNEMHAFDVTADLRRLMHKGRNTIAVVCRQKTGGQAIDMSLLLKKNK
ncbi:MAG: hypothetical protein LBV12_12050, partial [Puniceicoccales bacterium]|nr:hypothetical protein [Puniceicoccales bacterium]